MRRAYFCENYRNNGAHYKKVDYLRLKASSVRYVVNCYYVIVAYFFVYLKNVKVVAVLRYEADYGQKRRERRGEEILEDGRSEK